jgi:hypothetical protein
MKYADYACAWFIFAIGMIDVVLTEVTHPPGVILDTALLWIFVAMFNLLRLRNGGSIKGLTIVCIAANLAESVLEVYRMTWSPRPIVVVAVPILCETVFSIVRSRPRLATAAYVGETSSISLTDEGLERNRPFYRDAKIKGVNSSEGNQPW